jgi:hypothetical protein
MSAISLRVAKKRLCFQAEHLLLLSVTLEEKVIVKAVSNVPAARTMVVVVVVVVVEPASETRAILMLKPESDSRLLVGVTIIPALVIILTLVAVVAIV